MNGSRQEVDVDGKEKRPGTPKMYSEAANAP